MISLGNVPFPVGFSFCPTGFLHVELRLTKVFWETIPTSDNIGSSPLRLCTLMEIKC